MKTKLLFTVFSICYICNASAQWQQTTLSAGRFRQLTDSSKNIYAADGDYGALYISKDNGTTWVYDSTLKKAVTAITISGVNILAGTSYSGVFLSNDNGVSWSAINNGFTSTKQVVSLAAKGSTIYAGTYGDGVFLSINNGVSWTAVNNGLAELKTECIAINGTSVFVGTDGSGIFFSTNNGSNWVAVNSGLNDIYSKTVYSIGFIGTNIFAETSGGVYLSANNGANWTKVNSIGGYCLAIKGNNIFIPTQGGVLTSIDNGISWADISNGLPNTIGVWNLAVNNTFIYAATTNGIWKRPLSEITTGVTETNIKNDLTIYPNPIISGRLNIEYNNHIDQIEIYNLLGQIVLKSMATKILDVSQLEKGVYTIILSDKQNRVIKKFLVQ